MKLILACSQKALNIWLVRRQSIGDASRINKILLSNYKINIAIFVLLIMATVPVQTAHAACTMPSQTISINDVDIVKDIVPAIMTPGFTASCTYNEIMLGAPFTMCLRIEPTNDQYRSDNSFYLPSPDGSRIGFEILGGTGILVSVNKDSLPTNGITWGPVVGIVGGKGTFPFSLGTIRILPRSFQDIVREGVYNGTYNVYISQRENSGPFDQWNCSGIVPSSKNFAGTFSLSVNITKQCVFENFLDINFGSVGSVSALKNQMASGSIGIRCTSKTPYSIAIDNGLNASGGTRRMKSNNDFISYQLYQPDCSTPWDQTSVVGGIGGNVNQRNDHKVCAKLIAPTAVALGAGTYADTVIVTATF